MDRDQGNVHCLPLSTLEGARSIATQLFSLDGTADKKQNAHPLYTVLEGNTKKELNTRIKNTTDQNVKGLVVLFSFPLHFFPFIGF